MNSIRIRFTRGEEVKFISHLDLMKVFERAIRRSGLPMAYSQGFNPHPQMVFGMPLSVGMTSSGEYADFELVSEVEPAIFVQRLNEALPEAIRVTSAGVKKAKSNIMASIARADYIMELFVREELSPDKAEQNFEAMMRKDTIPVVKESKGKDGRDTFKETDIKPLILSAALEPMRDVRPGYEDFKSAFILKARFRAGNAANLRADLFIKALSEQAGIHAAASRLHRSALYTDIGGRMADPLDPAALE
ncbi:MAG TPA: TIGR03936 family radical SAM-associated protein [Clostridia bacterium]|nr:TIGR03936 family radical SAM-associated protein [Clostridia bacterium]